LFEISDIFGVCVFSLDESLRSWNLYIGETRGIAIALK